MLRDRPAFRVSGPRRRRRALVGALGLVSILVVAAVHPAAADPQPDPDSAQEQVRKQMVEVAGEIDTSKASLDEIDAALATLDANAANQQTALQKAQTDLLIAKAQQGGAERAIQASVERIELLRSVMRERAVRAYVHPPTDDVLTDLATGDLITASKRSVFISLRATSDADLTKQLRRAQDKLRGQKETARAAAAQAAEEKGRQEKLLADTKTAMGARHQLFEKLRVSLNELSARNEQLLATDQALTAQRAEAQAQLEARLLAEAEAEAQARLLAEAAAQAQLQAPAPPVGQVITPFRASSVTNGPIGEGQPLMPGVYRGSGLEGISLCNASGITVNCVIGAQVQAMLEAAKKSGITLTGGGFRDPRQQIALRQANCGATYDAVYQANASSCSPPTARPGTSQHEVGLAIDFSIGGSRSTAAFQWLSANAATYGFYNLPSEAWHWSTSGS